MKHAPQQHKQNFINQQQNCSKNIINSESFCKMEDQAICKHNQTGFCKFQLGCKKKHENGICPEEVGCSSSECPYRHPKSCRNFSRKGICKFGDDCAYKHEEINNINMNNDLYIRDTKEQYQNDIKNIKDEMIMIKETIVLMQNQITELNEKIQSSTKMNISEIVGLVVSLLDKPELSDISR